MGVVLSQAPGREPSAVLDAAQVADELGYRDLWIGEMAMFDAFVLATAIAARTHRIALTVGPLAVTVRTPVGIAMAAGSVLAATGRVVDLALGTSSPTVVAGWHGRDRAHSAALLADTAQALRPLLSGEKVDFTGDALTTKGFRSLVPSPESSITVAAFGAKAITAAARYADRMVLNMVAPESVARLRGELTAAAEAAGRPVPRLAAWIPVSVDPDEDALAQMRRSKVGYLSAPGYAQMFTEAGYGDLVEFARTRPHPREVYERIPNSLLHAIGAVGDVDTVLGRLGDFAAAGIDEIVLNPSTAGDPGGLRTLKAISNG
ncbi:LLM class F420-dependent oxidoreductase [Rhodococcus sp. H29-C3]|uniref:LLM class F420-dependent oxidoreductase n=1 Tax=Rhodococcus sp. H29-C3 TaxID=3046307 RepID=UPI0024B97895|nr:LLM class F420-dependent oxidoreductase [Rhodococcus sp. H29-C3]MDJ0361869.1 LLM class F420-dependent oxidoreductase [Rhodococcus sp. H29-C3]